MFKHSKAFTLIELLVVISIIGLLSSIVLVNLKGSRDKANIAKALDFSQSVYTALGADIVGYWRFDERSGTTAVDSSGYGNNGSIVGASYSEDTPHSLVGTGQGKYSLSFNGTDDYVDCGDGNSLDITTNVSVEAWIKNSETQTGIVFCKGDLSDSNYCLAYYFNYLGFLINDGANTNYAITEEGDHPLDEWFHVVGVVNGTTISLYVNGELVSGNFGSQSPITELTAKPSAHFIIGDQSSGGAPFKGDLDDVRIYSSALSLGQIQQHYAEGLEAHNNIVMK